VPEIDLLQQLILHEGQRGRPYKDEKGHWTIGIGRNLDANPLTDEEQRYLAMNDVNRAVRTLRLRLPWFETLDPIRQRVLIDLAFNMGIDGLLGFHNMLSTLQQAIRTGHPADYAEAADHLVDSKWAREDVGAERRDRLEHMLRTGEAPRL
jgi:lysozyme